MREIYENGQLVLWADDTSRTVTTYGPDGTVADTRPYTEEENAAADEQRDFAARVTSVEERLDIIEARLGIIDPPPGPDTPDDNLPVREGFLTAGQAVQPEAEIMANGKRWRNTSGGILTHGPDIYPQGYELLTETDPETGIQPWVQPSGAGGYDVGNRVIFEDHIWRSTFAGKNVWSPTAYPAAWVDEGVRAGPR